MKIFDKRNKNKEINMEQLALSLSSLGNRINPFDLVGIAKILNKGLDYGDYYLIDESENCVLIEKEKYEIIEEGE